MIVIHKYKEGYIPRNGLNYIRQGWRLTDLILQLGRRVMLLWSTYVGFGYFIDFRRDHRMYRPNDADQPWLFCRRCGLSALDPETDAFCHGKLYRRWRS